MSHECIKGDKAHRESKNNEHELQCFFQLENFAQALGLIVLINIHKQTTQLFFSPSWFLWDLNDPLIHVHKLDILQ